MNFHPYFLRFLTRSLANLVLVIAVGSVSLVCATSLQAQSEAERYVLEQVQKGEDANLESKFPEDRFPKETRELSGSFIERLLTNPDSQFKIHPRGVSIAGAVITGRLRIVKKEIPDDISLNCTFNEFVDLRDSHFAKSLNLGRSRFPMGVTLLGTTIDSDFLAWNCAFSRVAAFDRMRVGRDFSITFARFDRGIIASFERMQVGRSFDASNGKFFSADVSFNDLRVDGDFSVRHCTFTASKVSFVGAHFTSVRLDRSTFERSDVDFTRMKADYIAFDDVNFTTPGELKFDRMTFNDLSPSDPEKLQFLLSKYDAPFFADLEKWFRTHGYPDEADEIFIAKKRAERREKCENFLSKCNHRAWAWSAFQDVLAGYGRRLQNLLYWSLGFLLIGTIVFWREKGMRTKDWKDAPYYSGKYRAFWYSLDLFLPIIKLGEAETWTPKDNRRWAILYKKVHIIIGSLFVPIGLAAWTGIIK